MEDRSSYRTEVVENPTDDDIVIWYVELGRYMIDRIFSSRFSADYLADYVYDALVDDISTARIEVLTKHYGKAAYVKEIVRHAIVKAKARINQNTQREYDIKARIREISDLWDVPIRRSNAHIFARILGIRVGYIAAAIEAPTEAITFDVLDLERREYDSVFGQEG